jgi:tRNA dimethylallyltransferase
MAVRIAKERQGEVISCDSRQVYLGLNIGTGKVTSEEMAGVPHHLLDVAQPMETYTVSDYVRDASRAITDIHRRTHLPIVCGGTGHYASALLDGIVLPPVPPDTPLRAQLEQKSPDVLYAILTELDPSRATTIDRHNRRRLVRAIEIATHLGSVPPLSRQPAYDTLWIGIRVDMETLRERIHLRLKGRMETGMLEEVEALYRAGVSWERMESLGLEYRYLARYLTAQLTKDDMFLQLERAIIQYAKRQHTWWKKDTRIHWVDRTDDSTALALIDTHMKNRP